MEQAQISRWLSWMGRWHNTLIFERRVRVLSQMLAEQIPQGASVLDIGCGDGTVGRLISDLRPDISIQGVEVKPRPGCKIACSAFDGTTLPLASGSFDVCMFVDVLHHTEDVSILLREAARVTRRHVLLKDHLDENFADDVTLRFMDWVGNRPHGVELTYNYQSREEWDRQFVACDLEKVSFTRDVRLYPAPFSWVVGRGLHFVGLVKRVKVEDGA